MQGQEILQTSQCTRKEGTRPRPTLVHQEKGRQNIGEGDTQ